MSQNDLNPVIYAFQEDNIKALLGKKGHHQKSTSQVTVFYYVQWEHGIFADGWYNHEILRQYTPEILQKTFSKDKEERKKQIPELRSNSSFSQFSTSHTLCEWDCGHHEIGGVTVTRAHAVPKREHDQVKNRHPCSIQN